MIDTTELKSLAEAATPAPWCSVVPEGATINPTGSAILVGPRRRDLDRMVAYVREDADFIAAANPAAILALIAENENLAKDRDAEKRMKGVARLQRDVQCDLAVRRGSEIDQLKAEVEALQANASLINLLPELDEALEDLEIHGQHGDQGYRKLKDWYRKIALACKAIDAAMSEEAGHD